MSDNLTCPAGQRLLRYTPTEPIHLDCSPCLHHERSGKERRVWCARGGFPARPKCVAGICRHFQTPRQLFVRRLHPDRRRAQAAKSEPAPDFIGDGPGEIGTQWDPYDYVGKEPSEPAKREGFDPAMIPGLVGTSGSAVPRCQDCKWGRAGVWKDFCWKGFIGDGNSPPKQNMARREGEPCGPGGKLFEPIAPQEPTSPSPGRIAEIRQAVETVPGREEGTWLRAGHDARSAIIIASGHIMLHYLLDALDASEAQRIAAEQVLAIVEAENVQLRSLIPDRIEPISNGTVKQ